MKTTTTQTPSLQEEIQQAVAAAPSRQALADARAKLEQLGAQRASVEAEIKRLYQDLKDGKEEPYVRAQDLIEGKPLRECKTVNELGTARDRFAIIQEAANIQERKIREVEFQFAREVGRALRPALQRIVSRGVAAVKELQNAVGELDSLHSTAGTAGVNTTAAFPVGIVPPSAFGGADAQWIASVKALGFTV